MDGMTVCWWAEITHVHDASDIPSDRSDDAKPLLVYDGDCAFCIFWVRYWQKLTADAVNYRAYQDVAAHHPEGGASPALEYPAPAAAGLANVVRKTPSSWPLVAAAGVGAVLSRGAYKSQMKSPRLSSNFA
jgi:hypothetical protein